MSASITSEKLKQLRAIESDYADSAEVEAASLDDDEKSFAEILIENADALLTIAEREQALIEALVGLVQSVSGVIQKEDSPRGNPVSAPYPSEGREILRAFNSAKAALASCGVY